MKQKINLKEKFNKKYLEKNLNDILCVGIFFVVTCGLCIWSVLSPDKTFSENENRVLVVAPQIKFSSVFDGSFESSFEEYVNDQIVLRDRWINLKSLSELALLKKDVNGVYVGKEGYFMEMLDDIDEEFAYKNADDVIKFIGECNKSLGRENVHMMLVPTASAILSDYIRKNPQEFDQDALIDYMKDNLLENFIDVRDDLNEHRKEYIYYKTDHHWTSFGAYLAYSKWAKQCGVKRYELGDFEIQTFTKDFLGTMFSKINYYQEKDSIDIYKLNKEYTYKVDINDGMKEYDTMFVESHAEKKDKYSVFLDGNNPIVKINTVNFENDNKAQTTLRDRTLLVVKDSYAHCFVPFVANHYGNVVMVDLRYLKKPLSQVMEENKVTDVLVLYNVAHFAKDTNLCFISR